MRPSPCLLPSAAVRGTQAAWHRWIPGWLLFLGLLGCGEDDARTGVPDVAAEPAPRAAEAEAEPKPPPSTEHTVDEGQTLWDIARAYGVGVDDIMEANGLRPRDVRRLRKGSKLRIPGAAEPVEVTTAAERAEKMREELPEPTDGAYHFLASGETLWDLSRLYDKSVDEIMARNELGDDDARGLRPGSPVLIPGIEEKDVKRSEPAERKGITHTLAYGETVWDLANAFQVSVGEIMASNGLGTDQVTALREGQRLFIPGVTRDRRGKVTRKLPPRQRRALQKARLLGLGTRQAASRLLAGRVEKRWLRAAGGRGNRLPGTLRWPVTNGWYTRGFGSGEGNYHQAIDIMGDVGWNVRAAERGIVAYSGNDVRGYGNMVLVIHPGGWVTMYAHNSVNFVVAGERVPRGGILAEVGSTGISRGPHVHFELLFQGRNCDPAPLMRPGVRHRSGAISSSIRKVTWRDPKDVPGEVACQRRRRHPRSRWVIHE